MSLASVSRMEAKLLLPTYERQPILFVRGRGVHLWDSNGKRYLDFLSGIGVNALGHNSSCNSDGDQTTGESFDSCFQSVLPRVPGGTCAAADEDLRDWTALSSATAEPRHGKER